MKRLVWERVESDGHADGNRTCFGRAKVEGGYIYEFARWHNGATSTWGVFVPDKQIGVE